MDGLQVLVETHCKTLSKFQDELKTLVKYAEKADKKTMLIRGVLIAVLVVLIVAAFLR